MASTAVARRLRSRLADRFVSYELEWATDAPMAGIVEDQLDAAHERVDDADDGPVWRRTNRIVPDDRLEITDEGCIRVYRQFGWWVRLVLLVLVLLAPLLVTNLSSVGLYFLLALILDRRQYSDKPIPAATEIVTDWSNGLVGSIAILSLLGTVVFVLDITDYWIVIPFGVIGFGIALTYMYLSDGLPFVSPDLAKRPMQIPFVF